MVNKGEPTVPGLESFPAVLTYSVMGEVVIPIKLDAVTVPVKVFAPLKGEEVRSKLLRSREIRHGLFSVHQGKIKLRSFFIVIEDVYRV